MNPLNGNIRLTNQEIEDSLNQFVRAQRKWMKIGYTSSAIGICLMYVLLRSFLSSWPTILTLITDSAPIQLGLIFGAGWGITLHMHADNVVRRKWAELGRLTATLELPLPDVSILRRYVWIPVVIVLNELSALLIYLARR